MSRRAATPADVDDLTCLLCGAAVRTWEIIGERAREWVAYELCDACARAFREAADRVAARMVAAIRYEDHCVVCGATITETSPAGLLAAMVEHYDGHVTDEGHVPGQLDLHGREA